MDLWHTLNFRIFSNFSNLFSSKNQTTFHVRTEAVSTEPDQKRGKEDRSDMSEYSVSVSQKQTSSQAVIQHLDHKSSSDQDDEEENPRQSSIIKQAPPNQAEEPQIEV